MAEGLSPWKIYIRDNKKRLWYLPTCLALQETWLPTTCRLLQSICQHQIRLHTCHPQANPLQEQVHKLDKNSAKNFNSHPVVNGHLSLRILLDRGCRQGDPIAGCPFILAIEVLLLRIFHERAIQGQQTMPTGIHHWCSTSGRQHLFDGYTDNLSLYLRQGNIPREDTGQFSNSEQIQRSIQTNGQLQKDTDRPLRKRTVYRQWTSKNEQAWIRDCTPI